jgi:predicted nucleotidyltransferase
MVSMENIQDLCDRIAREFHPERIILFGSYARGDANEDSDVDLLVIMPFEGLGARKATEIRKAVRPRFAVDLIVRTPETVRERIELGDFFLRDATVEGKVLHDAAHV